MEEFLQSDTMVVIWGFIAANAGTILLIFFRAILQHFSNKKRDNQMSDLINYVDKTIEDKFKMDQELKDEIWGYAKQCIDSKYQKENEVLEQKATKLLESTEEKQDSVTVDDILGD